MSGAENIDETFGFVHTGTVVIPNHANILSVQDAFAVFLTSDKPQDFFNFWQTKTTTNRNLDMMYFFWLNKTKFGLTDTDVPYFLKFQKLNSE